MVFDVGLTTSVKITPDDVLGILGVSVDRSKLNSAKLTFTSFIFTKGAELKYVNTPAVGDAGGGSVVTASVGTYFAIGLIKSPST